ncbi:AraC family transcriptional regulator N-terminal domain-containing protein [Paraflavitalea speifideaquila]|uniref:AraC family transcriptional regulator N-terminal domain-containing protein n=1 Tax=Paraflavitalea speifideaquila TaxID=3076558 RepID=UPI0028EE48E6|nr:AraC family transcriptional regulator N-terminal domain-containing protein [Paraflavitalea speifideiaquila]
MDDPAFEYMPGETAMVPANKRMVIDFPEAQLTTPTQCIALTVDNSYVNEILHYLNEYYNSDKHERNEWTLQFNQYHFTNDHEISMIINKLIRICCSSEKPKTSLPILA